MQDLGQALHCPILQALVIVHVEVRDSADGTDAVVPLLPEAINLGPTLGEVVVKDLGEALMPKP